MDANWSSTGLTNDVAASKFGFMAPNTISQWRTGRSAVPISRLPKIAELLRVDLVPLFILWLRQARLRNDVVPSILIEVLERRLMSANEADVIKTLRHATRNSDPAFSASALGAIARAATGV